MMDEIKIQEAKTEKIKLENEADKESEISRLRLGQEKKNDLYIELALFLILGVLIGIAVKNEAVKRITIGFDDYAMKFYAQDYDLNRMQDEQIQKMIEEQSLEENNLGPEEGETGENQKAN